MIGDFLKSIRKEQKIKVVELAQAVGVSQPYISNIENEKRYPTVELFFKIIISLAELAPLNDEVFSDLALNEEVRDDYNDSTYAGIDDYSLYSDPEYVKSQVFDYWYQYFLADFIDNSTSVRVFNNISEDEYIKIMLSTLEEQEVAIYKAVVDLKSKTGMFKLYSFQEDKFKDVLDLSIFDSADVINKVMLDGKRLNSDGIECIQNTLNGIRYARGYSDYD